MGRKMFVNQFPIKEHLFAGSWINFANEIIIICLYYKQLILFIL